MAAYTFNGKALDEGQTGWVVVSEMYQAATSVGEYLPQLLPGKQSAVITSPWNYSPPEQRTILAVNGGVGESDEEWWRLQRFLSPMRGGVTLGTTVGTEAVDAPAHLDYVRVIGPTGSGQTLVLAGFIVDDYGMRASAARTEEAGAGKFAGSTRPITEALICFTTFKSGVSLGDWGSGRYLYWFGDPRGYANLNIDTARRLAFLSPTPFDFRDGVDASAGLVLEDEWMLLPGGDGNIGFSGVRAQVRARPYLR